MKHSDEAPLELSYSTDGKAPVARAALWTQSLPAWLIGLILLVPIWIFEYRVIKGTFGWGSGETSNNITTFLFYASMSIPAALRRANWRHVLVLVGLAELFCALSGASGYRPIDMPLPYSLALWAGLPIAIIGLGEWILASSRAWQSLVWLLVLATAGGCLLPLVQQPLDFTGTNVAIPCAGGLNVPVGTLIYWPLLVVLTWNAIPAGLALGAKASRARRFFAATFAVISAASFALFFHFLITD